jgi:hypothetical protein
MHTRPIRTQRRVLLESSADRSPGPLFSDGAIVSLIYVPSQAVGSGRDPEACPQQRIHSNAAKDSHLISDRALVDGLAYVRTHLRFGNA